MVVAVVVAVAVAVCSGGTYCPVYELYMTSAYPVQNVERVASRVLLEQSRCHVQSTAVPPVQRISSSCQICYSVCYSVRCPRIDPISSRARGTTVVLLAHTNPYYSKKADTSTRPDPTVTYPSLTVPCWCPTSFACLAPSLPPSPRPSGPQPPTPTPILISLHPPVHLVVHPHPPDCRLPVHILVL